MMKLKLSLKFVALITAVIASLTPLKPGLTSTFEEQELDQAQFAAVAFPFGGDKYNLWLIEQIPGKNACWSQSGTNPVVVDLLLMNFDFTGHCRRGTDSNSYSIRMDGEDYGLDYILRIIPGNGELLLVGSSRTDRSKPDLIIARTGGLANGFLKFNLEPGWVFSRRAFQGKPLGHVYFSYTTGAGSVPTNPQIPSPTSPTTNPLPTMPTGNPAPMTPSPTPSPNSELFPGMIDITKPSSPTQNQ